MSQTASRRTFEPLSTVETGHEGELARDGVEVACRAAGVDPGRVAEALKTELVEVPPVPSEWDGRPISELIAHIVDKHHLPVVVELERLEQLLDRLLREEGATEPERFELLLGAFTDLRDELLPHLLREEQVLFPWILSGQGATAGSPVRVMLHDHGRCLSLLEELRAATDGFVPQDGASEERRRLWSGLEALNLDLREHIRLENDVLFPRALAGG